ncbi:splicing factor, CC1-like protein [Piedraia hortae CBS 480.64]|uniref:Splicing factor, CC1-like protein n=1 Tax=Piedraia hortae CBS 480.64 TaxID=1314780 RepID=A0A6A7C0F8_9PEZI|nr:splicing factor, CC1-like protein [Piedraia hortae CBS 480.64]
MDAAVAELLEQEEKKAIAKQQAERRHDRDGRDSRSAPDTNRYSAEREANDARRSRKSLGADVEMKDADDGSSTSGRPVSRRRSRSPRSRGLRYRDRHEDRYSGDHYHGTGTRRSPDDDRHYRPDSRRHEHHRERDRGRRDSRDADRPDRPGRRSRRCTPPSKRVKTPEPTDDDSDRRTVFVQQLAARLRTSDLQKFFETVGPVVEAQIVKDRVSGRSKGVGYVEFKDEESVPRAIAMTGQKLLGIPIIAQLTEAEKNRLARANEGATTQSNGVPFHRLYVGNIHFSITEEDLKNVFEPFGELEFVQLQKEDQGRSRGYGFVQFKDPGEAKDALEKMNGFELAGRPIRVGLGNDKFTAESTHSLLQRFSSQAQQAQQGSSFSGMGGRGAHAGGLTNFDRATGRDTEKSGGASALDDTDVAGVNFSNFSRDSLMRKLARVEEPSQKTAIPTNNQKRVAVPEQQAPSRCVLLKNMYSPEEAAGPSWQKELEDDVRLECEEKYGPVVHIGLALDNTDGEIYVKFDTVQGGQNAIRGLNGRWFDGRTITAQYVVDHIYSSIFPKAAKL